MGLLVLLGLLAVPIILIAVITRGRDSGNPPPDTYDRMMSRGTQDMARRLLDKEKP
ncbi:MAG TPA: hypothetical protein VFE17_02860 [Candidatus Baltobacteraceae bacterium]|nr:hypothetical protein [Candidatus Baltobacteraceae bacterium]